jgi:hypothetical protein
MRFFHFSNKKREYLRGDETELGGVLRIVVEGHDGGLELISTS